MIFKEEEDMWAEYWAHTLLLLMIHLRMMKMPLPWKSSVRK